jgi:hypothetical protein
MAIGFVSKLATPLSTSSSHAVEAEAARATPLSGR